MTNFRQQRVGREQREVKSRQLLAELLCLLLVLFAVGAKLAMYQPQPQAKPLAATKVWQSSAQPSDESPREALTPSLFDELAVTALLMSLVLASIWQVALDEPLLPAPNWFSPYLAVRPPPSL